MLVNKLIWHSELLLFRVSTYKRHLRMRVWMLCYSLFGTHCSYLFPSTRINHLFICSSATYLGSYATISKFNETSSIRRKLICEKLWSSPPLFGFFFQCDYNFEDRGSSMNMVQLVNFPTMRELIIIKHIVSVE